MKKAWLLVVLAPLTGCAAEVADEAAPDRESLPVLGIADYRRIDLSWGYGGDTLFWPTTTQRFDLQEVAYGPAEGGYFYSAYNFCAPEHGGTHLDAPRHFAENGWTADEIPLDRLLTPAVVIDVSEQATADRDYRLTVADVDAWEAEHGPVPAGATVYLRTGWGSRWPDALDYLGDDTPGDASNLHFPSYGEEAARRLVERGVVALGVDTASIDYGASTDFIVHQVANGANVIGLENVAHLEELPPTGAWTVALPMKIVGGSGGPVRIVALVPLLGTSRRK